MASDEAAIPEESLSWSGSFCFDIRNAVECIECVDEANPTVDPLGGVSTITRYDGVRRL